MDKKEIARESKKLKKNHKLIVTRVGRGYWAYLVRGSKPVQVPDNERIMGVIDGPMTVAQVTEWLAGVENKKKKNFFRREESEKVKRIRAMFGK